MLPFQTVGAGADTTFADGLSDAVTGKLAQLAGLRVIDRGSVLAVHDAAASPQATGRLLDAEYALHAVVRWVRGADGASQVQVTPRLVRVSDGTTHWAGEPTVVSPADPFAVQAAIATEVAQALGVALGSAERARLARAATRDTGALAALEQAGANPTIALYPDGFQAGQYAVTSEEVYGLLGDVEAMLPRLRRAITMPNGRSAASLLTEPAFLRYRDDSRFRALARLRPAPVRSPE